MSEELKCPFCGNKLVYSNLTDKWYCQHTPCMLSHKLFSAKEWSYRPAQDALQAEIDRLQAELREESGRRIEMIAERNAANGYASILQSKAEKLSGALEEIANMEVVTSIRDLKHVAEQALLADKDTDDKEQAGCLKNTDN